MFFEKNQVYRASVAAIIFNDKDEVFMVQNQNYRDDEWDFVKGGMDIGEDVLETVAREIKEEVGEDFKFDIVKESKLQLIYDWSPENQKRRGMRGQARISFWIKHLGGEIKINTDELRNAKWLNKQEFEDALRSSGFTDFQIDVLLNEYSEIVT